MAVAELEPTMTNDDYRLLSVACETALRRLPEDSQRRSRFEALARMFSLAANDLGALSLGVKTTMAILAEFGCEFHYFIRPEDAPENVRNQTGVMISSGHVDDCWLGSRELAEFEKAWAACITRHVEDVVYKEHSEVKPRYFYQVGYQLDPGMF